jgi:ADP-heptose:LPS heptosyltransferase
MLAAIAAIRKLRCVAALDLFYNPRSAWLLFVSGIPIRVGGSRRWRRRLYTDVVTVPDSVRSAVGHHLHALSLFDASTAERLPRVHLTEAERERGSVLLAEHVPRAARGRPLVAMHPGGTWPAKRWRIKSFARLSSIITERLGAGVMVVAGPGEEEIARSVQDRAGDGVFTLPLQPIRTLASVFASCSAVVANDGGVLHLAVALGRPTVGIFGPTEPDIWFPYEGKGPFALATRNEHCAPCHLHECDDMCCLDRLEVDTVFEKLQTVMANGE